MSAEPPNVLLVVLDSLKASNTSLHGYQRETTPFLDSFSRDATVYTQARSPGMTSLPSHASIFTGLEVEEHGVHDLLTHRLDPTSTVWHRLSEEYDYRTGVFSDNVNLTGDASLADCFDYVVGRRGRMFPDAPDPDIYFNSPQYLDGDDDRSKYVQYLGHCLRSDRPFKGFANGMARQLSRSVTSATLERYLDHSAKRFLNPFYSWIDSQDGPWAACVNLMDTHLPFCPHADHDSWGGNRLQRKQARLDPTSWEVYGGQVSWEDWAALEDLYDGTVRQADRYVRRLITELKTRGIFDDTLVVVTSDHGEGFGEYSRVRPDFRIAGHIVGLHESLLHVPLIVSYPDQETGDEVTRPVTLRRFPRAVEAAVSGEWTGTEFVPDRPVIASASTIDTKLKNAKRARTYCSDLDRFKGDIRAVYRERNGTVHKYLTWDGDAVTVEIADARTVRTVEEGNPREQVQDAFAELTDAGVSTKQGDVSEETLGHLESLGYV